MIKTGLVSITFRKLSPERIVELVRKAGLEGIEWGGDIHVPHGDIKKAAYVRKLTCRAGLETAAYGSYYRTAAEQQFTFEDVLDTAVELKAPVIRVWAGDKGSKEADGDYMQKVAEDSVRIAEMASKKGIRVAYEYHRNTLTDTNESALRLLKEVNHSGMKSCWQPPLDYGREKRLEGLKMIMPWLENIHVYHWDSGERLPLEQGKAEWKEYLEKVSKDNTTICYSMLEFVKDDSPEQFLDDAKTLKQLITACTC